MSYLEDELICSFQLAAYIVGVRVWQFVYDTDRSAFLERDLVGLREDGNWQVWVRYCGAEPVSIHTV